MKIKEAKNFFEGRNEVIKIEGVRKYCRDEGEKSPYTWLFVGGIRTLHNVRLSRSDSNALVQLMHDHFL